MQHFQHPHSSRKGGVHKTDGFWWVIFQRGEYTKPMGLWWVIFQRGGVHKTDGFWWVIFQRGEYTKPTAFDGWFFKGGSTQNRWAVMGDFFICFENWVPGAFISENTGSFLLELLEYFLLLWYFGILVFLWKFYFFSSSAFVDYYFHFDWLIDWLIDFFFLFSSSLIAVFLFLASVGTLYDVVAVPAATRTDHHRNHHC